LIQNCGPRETVSKNHKNAKERVFKGVVMDYIDTTPKFYDPALFDFLKPLKDNWEGVLKEFSEVAKTRTHPWPETNLFTTTTYENDKAATVEGEGWNVFGLYAFNKKRTDNCKLCPFTTALIEAFPYQVRYLGALHL
jgi:aspartyl/asparaginyl beta-hydroxylase (cupin superfamily)